MAVINAYGRFKERKRMSIPIVKVPRSVREAFNIDTMFENGIAKLERGKRDCLYDRCYVFEDVNYINRDEKEKEQFLNLFMTWLKTMNVEFKITLANEYQSMEEFLGNVSYLKDSRYPLAAKGVEEWIRGKLAESGPNVTRLRYLTVSCRAGTLKDARIFFQAFDKTAGFMFSSWKGRIMPLDGISRLYTLHSLLRPGKKEEEAFIRLEKGHDWKNDVYPGSIRSRTSYMVMDDVFICMLYGARYTGALDPDSLLQTLSNTEYPSFITMDYAPVPPDVINDFLVAAGMNVDKAISDEEEKRRKHNIISSGPSYAKQRKKDEVESLADQVSDNEETGFYMNFLMAVTARDEGTLGIRVREVMDLAKREKVILETADFQQLKSLNTALPIGGRQVDFMRFFLASSIVAFQPYHCQDIIEPGGIMYGTNRTTGRPIIGNRKLLPNPHGIFLGHTGHGKSAMEKLITAQTMMNGDDDIILLDPQNECQEFVRAFDGRYFDLTPKSGVFLNGFEVYEDVFYGDLATKEKFIAVQTNYAKSLMPAIMNNITFTQEHATFVGRCMRRMFEKVFAQKKLKIQPTLMMLREEIGEELARAESDHDRDIIRPVYNSLEEYTEGACDMLAHPSNIRFDERLVGFGLKNIPEDNWEAVMLTVMHYVTTRLEYNQKDRRAVHFIVDEAQIISRKGSSAEQLNTAVVTFRKFGGIVTLVMQNIMAARDNPRLRELFANCSFKCFLDQGGMDAEIVSQIQELSAAEYAALDTDEVGKGVLVWGKKVALFDSVIPKDNPLYGLINTNFHEKKLAGTTEEENGEKEEKERKAAPDEAEETGQAGQVLLPAGAAQELTGQEGGEDGDQ